MSFFSSPVVADDPAVFLLDVAEKGYAAFRSDASANKDLVSAEHSRKAALHVAGAATIHFTVANLAGVRVNRHAIHGLDILMTVEHVPAGTVRRAP